MFVLVGATCFLFAALPRLFDAFSDDGLRAAFSNAPVAAQPPAARTGPHSRGRRRRPALGGRTARGAVQHEALPAALDDLVVERSFVVRSPSYVQPANEGLVRYLNLRVPAAGVESRLPSSPAGCHARRAHGYAPSPRTSPSGHAQPRCRPSRSRSRRRPHTSCN